MVVTWSHMFIFSFYTWFTHGFFMVFVTFKSDKLGSRTWADTKTLINLMYIASIVLVMQDDSHVDLLLKG